MEEMLLEIGRTIGSLLVGGGIVAWLAKRFVKNIENQISENADTIKAMKDRIRSQDESMGAKVTKVHERVDALQAGLPNDYVRRPEYDQMNARFDRIEVKLDRLLERQ